LLSRKEDINGDRNAAIFISAACCAKLLRRMSVRWAKKNSFQALEGNRQGLASVFCADLVLQPANLGLFSLQFCSFSCASAGLCL